MISVEGERERLERVLGELRGKIKREEEKGGKWNVIWCYCVDCLIAVEKELKELKEERGEE